LNAGFSTPKVTGRSNSDHSAGCCASTNKELPKGKILEAVNLQVYTLGELKRATEKVKRHTIIGEGEFGVAHKGWVL